MAGDLPKMDYATEIENIGRILRYADDKEENPGLCDLSAEVIVSYIKNRLEYGMDEDTAFVEARSEWDV